VSKSLAKERGMEMRFLKHSSMHFRLDENTQREVAEIVEEVKPTTAFMLWPHDRHPDHEAAASICKAALAQPRTILGRDCPNPRRIYCFDNGPGHTIGFEPNTFVDVTQEWDAAMDWLGGAVPGRDVRGEICRSGVGDASGAERHSVGGRASNACHEASQYDKVRILTFHDPPFTFRHRPRVCHRGPRPTENPA
jgi:hypothetical protein